MWKIKNTSNKSKPVAPTHKIFMLHRDTIFSEVYWWKFIMHMYTKCQTNKFNLEGICSKYYDFAPNTVILKKCLWQLVMGKKCMKPLDFVRKYCRHALGITKLVIFHCHGIKTTITVFGLVPWFFIHSSARELQGVTQKR